MDLKALGFDEHFESHAAEILQDGQLLARVMAVDRSTCLLQNIHGEHAAELAGRFRFEVEAGPEYPCVGDWVCVDHTSPDLPIIHAVLPRKSFLRRKSPGKTVDYQMIAANLDVAFIIQSCHYDFNVRRLERYLVAANEGHVEPVILLSKSDMVSPEELEVIRGRIRSAGIEQQLLAISNLTGSGLEAVEDMLSAGRTYCLLGSSGVGKTTLLNRILGQDTFETRQISDYGKGVHTTSRRQMILLEKGALLVDTPGMREFGMLGTGSGIKDSFSDIDALAHDCRFADCSHVREPGCAVREAMDAGELAEERLQSYQKLQKETDYHNASYLDKRNKDRAFGRSVKSFKKHRSR